MGTGQRREESALEARFGADTARQLFQLAEAGRKLVKELVTRHQIDCELTPGQLICATKPAHFRELAKRATKLSQEYDYPHQRVLSSQELGDLVDSPVYEGGILDTGASHLHPLNYALGLARACLAAGVLIYEHSPITGYSGTGPVLVRTPQGEVRAKYLVLGCNGYLDSLEPRIANRIMPINNFMLATAPLGSIANRLIALRACVHDTFLWSTIFACRWTGG